MSHKSLAARGINSNPERMTAGRVLDLFRANHAAWSSRMQFGDAMAAIRQRIAGGATQAAVVLADQRGWKTALLALAPQAEIPLHDHPRTRGVLYVETGSVEVERYDILFRPPIGRSVMLAERGTVHLEAGDHDWIGSRRHNLHALKAGDTGALVFSVRQTEDGAAEASVYACLDRPGGPSAGTRIALAIPAGGQRKAAELD